MARVLAPACPLHAGWRNACSNQFSRWTPRLPAVSITVSMRKTKRLTALLFVPMQHLHPITAGHRVHRASWLLGSTPLAFLFRFIDPLALFIHPKTFSEFHLVNPYENRGRLDSFHLL
jgi:hypothetical protein